MKADRKKLSELMIKLHELNPLLIQDIFCSASISLKFSEKFFKFLITNIKLDMTACLISYLSRLNQKSLEDFYLAVPVALSLDANLAGNIELIQLCLLFCDANSIMNLLVNLCTNGRKIFGKPSQLLNVIENSLEWSAYSQQSLWQMITIEIGDDLEALKAVIKGCVEILKIDSYDAKVGLFSMVCNAAYDQELQKIIKESKAKFPEFGIILKD